MKRITDWIRQKLGIKAVETKVTSLENEMAVIERMLRVGVDLGFKSPSWIVVCARGKGEQDVVRFFEMPGKEVFRLLEELKWLEKQYHIHPVFDAPSYIKKELWHI